MTSHSTIVPELQQAVQARAPTYDRPYSEFRPASPRKPIVLSPSLAPKLNSGDRLMRNGCELSVVSTSFHSESWNWAGLDQVAAGRNTSSMTMLVASFHQLLMTYPATSRPERRKADAAPKRRAAQARALKARFIFVYLAMKLVALARQPRRHGAQKRGNRHGRFGRGQEAGRRGARAGHDSRSVRRWGAGVGGDELGRGGRRARVPPGDDHVVLDADD